MRSNLKSRTALVALAITMPAMAHAQSTGTDAVEEEILVLGSRSEKSVSGFDIPETSKARATMTSEAIQRQTAGQSILNTINMLPGVSFQNNDGYGSAGGTLTVRGFDSSRVSLTWDGMPMNDSGNYAIYSSQLLDPEVIDKITVSLGTTDVDSPTASAAGGTVSYQTRTPSEAFGALASASFGDYDFHRIFLAVDTGAIGPLGTRAFIAASRSVNDNPFNGFGVVNKKQVNARIYQPIGSNGDFISIAGHYNQSRNNFFGSVGLRNDRLPTAGFPQTRDERFYEVPRCTVSEARPGVRDVSNRCGSTFDERWNPSNTGNIRMQSRFSLADNVILTVDPSFQYVKANGGGTVRANEGVHSTGVVGYIGGAPWAGVDLNGDGDIHDQVEVLAPSQTQTRRYGVAASLIYSISEQHRVRLTYTLDHARHRQTGQVGLLDQSGRPFDVFPVNDPVLDASGNPLQKRDRKSFAILHRIAGEYVGRFMEDRLIVNVGLAMPFFKRDLTQNCFTTSAGGFVDCFNGNSAAEAIYGAANPVFVAPMGKTLNFRKLLPNAGFNLQLPGDMSIFGNYAMGIAAPSTDNLYNAFWFEGKANAPAAPRPETTDSFDLGIRYTNNRIVAQLAGWYTKFSNRTASAFEPELNETIFRNLGTVEKYGVDTSIAWQPVDAVTAYLFASYLKSKIKDDVQTGANTFAPTGGKRESGSPDWTIGGRLETRLGPIELGAQAKYTGKRYIFDTNTPLVLGGVEVYPAATKAYTLVDLDARLSLAQFGLERSHLQINVTNLFDRLYVGGFGGGLQPGSSAPFVQIGAPRTISGSLVVGF